MGSIKSRRHRRESRIRQTTAGTSTVAVTLTDAAGAVATKNLSLTIVATPTITSVVLANGGATQGQIEKSDTITVTFSTQMSVSSFCSTWSNDAANQSLAGNGDCLPHHRHQRWCPARTKRLHIAVT